MPKVEFKTLIDLRQRIGQEVAISDWVAVTQQRIDLFAEATDDHQWIHVDPTRAAAESPFHTTVAHGFFTLSLLPHLMSEALTLPPSKLTINYGLNRVRFPAPVRAGQQIRARIILLTMEDISGGVQITWKVTVELEGSDKPACIAETISRRYDN
jgi:acyl dehydratase